MPKYLALKIFATLLRAVAAFILVFAVVGLLLIFSVFDAPELARFARGIRTVWMFAAVLIALPLWCYADLLQVFMDIEENTRNLQRAPYLQEAIPQRTSKLVTLDLVQTKESDRCPECGSTRTITVPNQTGAAERECAVCGRIWRVGAAA